MSYTESALTFPIGEDVGVGILSMPTHSGNIGVLIGVGGPQYRVGSHRQFLLLSRALAGAGFPTMRFDFRGMGDSTGGQRDFESVSTDFATAIDVFLSQCPTVERVVLWGLCDAASASLLYWDATHDVRVQGMVLLNPWVRSTASLAKTHVKHYYGQRLLEADFWCKLLTGKLAIGQAVQGLIRNLKSASQKKSKADQGEKLSFQSRMARCVERFRGPLLFVLSESDYTAKEFIEVSNTDPSWMNCMKQPNIHKVVIPDADHTFSSANWRRQVEDLTTHWLQQKV